MPEPEKEHSENLEKSSSFREQLRRFSLAIAGFSFIVFGTFLEHLHEAKTPQLEALKATDSFKFHVESFLWSTVPYGIEHLGVVLVVAFLVWEWIEKRDNREFVKEMRDRIGMEVQTLTKEALIPLRDTISSLQDDMGIIISNAEVLDTESIQELKQKVLSPTFIRTEYTLDLTVEPYKIFDSKSNEGYVKVTCRTAYIVKNFTDIEAEYTVRGWLDIMEETWFPPNIEKGKFTRLTYGLKEKMAQDDERPIEALEGYQKTTKDGALALTYKLRNKINGGEEYFVNMVGTQVMRAQDLFIWNMSALTKKFIVKVRLAGGLTKENFQVVAREMHHHEGMIEDSQADAFCWTIKNTLLPHQGIQIWWSPIDEVARTNATQEVLHTQA